MPTPQYEKVFDLKVRSYSNNIMAYRIFLNGQFQYVINEMYLSETKNILSELCRVGNENPAHGFIILQKGYIFATDRNYMFSDKDDTYIYNKTANKVVPLIRYNKYKRND